MLLIGLVLAGTLRLCVGREFGWPQGNLFTAVYRLFIAGWADGSAQSTVLDIRLLRVTCACLVGLALAASGVALQALLRNPLAEPFILGLSSGAALGIMVQWLIVYSLYQQFGGSHLGALLGSMASALIVYSASRRRGMIDPLGLLLTGVVLSTVNGAVIMLLNYLKMPAGMREDIGRWMMGYLNETVTTPALLTVALLTVAGVVLLAMLGRAMDAASFSDAEAVSLGVNLKFLRTLLFIMATVLTGGAVVLAGPIGFVGLICPHLARLMLGPGHRQLVIGSALLGAMLVILADTLAVVLDRQFNIGLMPIGIFTAMLGGPLFLWMLHPKLGMGER
ncbi:MAG: iron ABC transporter permease [Phycisphaerales bacterium]|nr:iron ABC transporter permease [Phycisphaerales bacterium]